jgi:hypothetical protein
MVPQVDVHESALPQLTLLITEYKVSASVTGCADTTDVELKRLTARIRTIRTIPIPTLLLIITFSNPITKPFLEYKFSEKTVSYARPWLTVIVISSAL